MGGNTARKLRRVAAKKQGKKRQLDENTAQLGEALSALGNMQGLQQVVEGMEGLGQYVTQMETALGETRQLVDALVEDYQTMADERELERKVLCRVLARIDPNPYQSAESVETIFNEEAEALQAEDT